MTAAAPSTPSGGDAAGGRLEWLDALRGVAVLGVITDHATYLVFPQVHRQVITPWFDIGTCGVMVFFLVSGYIVPASLERHGSIRRFWASRVFRLYPVWVIGVGGWLLFGFLGVVDVDHNLLDDPVAWLAGHLTMLQDLLGVPNTVNVLWTLSYEMAFYLALTALFVIGAHRRPSALALGLAVTAVVTGGVLPAAALSRGGADTRWVAVAAAVVLVAGLAGVMRGKRPARLAGAAVLGGVSVVLLAVNARTGAWESLLIPAVMFAGTALHRAERGLAGRGVAVTVAVAVLVCGVAGGVYHSGQWNMDGLTLRDFRQSWSLALVAVAVLFLLGRRLWRRRTPRALVWIGTISYPLYLLHPLAINVFRRSFGANPDRLSFLAQCGIAVGFLALLFTSAWAAHRYVEEPMRRLGRRVGTAVDGGHVLARGRSDAQPAGLARS